jgi:hypothetical protein
MMAKYASIHLRTPLYMLGMLLSGVLLSLGHHLFYQSLHGKPIATDEEGAQHFSQRVNVAIGTAFAFLVKSALVVSVNMAYYQFFWKMAKQASSLTNGPTLKWLDTAFSGASNALLLLKVPMWLRSPLLFAMASAIWYVVIP